MSKQRIKAERRAKRDHLRAMGIEPYAGKVDITAVLATLRQQCPDQNEDDNKEPLIVTAAGRIKAIRDMGKSKWLDIADRSGTLQINLLQRALGEANFAVAKLLDIGDYISVTGKFHKSKVGEPTIFATEMTILCKSIEPLSAKYRGLRDVETRYRRRYLDLITSDASRQRFINRSKLISHIRHFLDSRDFLEVETPMLQSIYGGAAARPFITHHNSLETDLYLRISPETYLKRLLVGGLDRVYEINRNFRNEGTDTKHNPEFTMIEIYQAYSDFEGMMELTESLVSSACYAIHNSYKVQYGDEELDFTPPWPRKRIHELISEVVKIDPDDTSALRQACIKAGLAGDKLTTATKDIMLTYLMDEVIEPTLRQPIFVTHYPASLNPLCKRNSQDPSLIDRFEAFVAGMELGNAYSELNDPDEQRSRFEDQIAQADEESYCNSVDEDFCSALEIGMPPAGGLGIGIDRLVMLLTNTTSIRDVILFPTLRPRSQKEIAAENEADDEEDESETATEAKTDNL